MQPEKRGCVIMRKCHLVVEAALKEGVALQELHLEEIREGLVWLCTNAMCDSPNFMSLLACEKLTIIGWGFSTYPSQKV